jgi:hypothetical protein
MFDSFMYKILGGLDSFFEYIESKLTMKGKKNGIRRKNKKSN